jgi:hypothetical protein
VNPAPQSHWLTIREFARVMDCSPRYARLLIDNGTVAGFSIPVYARHIGRRRRLYVCTPPTLLDW